MRNTRDCHRCGHSHWRDGKLCFDCSEDDIRPITQAIIDTNAHLRTVAEAKETIGADLTEVQRGKRRKCLGTKRHKGVRRR